MRFFRCVRLGGISLAILWLSFSPFVPIALADNNLQSPWLASSPPTLEKISEVNPLEPIQKSIISNRDCQTREVVTRPQRIVAPLQSKISHPSCVTDTGFGAYSTSGYLQRPDSDIYGLLKAGRGGSGALLPIPRSTTALWLSGGSSNGSYLFFYDNLERALLSSSIFSGEVTHKLPLQHSAILTNGDGALFSVNTDSASFSANGDWMVADIPSVAMARINIKTREVLPFGNAINYGIGLDPLYRTAVSPDGRYALVASKNFEILRLYDLSTCTAPPAVIKTKVPCSSRDLLPFMRQQVPGFTSLASVRFRSNYTLDLYTNSVVGQISKLTRYVATADGQKATGFQYLALGDSFASGEGAYQYKAATDVTDNKCHLSQRSYPYLISSSLKYGQAESVACSGALIEDAITDDPGYLGQTKDGVRLDSRNYGDFLPYFRPGYLPQKEFGKKHQPQIVTVSVGGNDIGFRDIILRCLVSDTCYGSFEERFEIAQLINSQFDSLTEMYREIKSSADPRAKIYVIGYPQIAKPGGNCALNVHLNNDEIVFSAQLISYLNNVIKTAAANAGVFYADVEDAFEGNRLCETESWKVAMNGLTAGNDLINMPFVHGPVANESYHPNAFGHELLKTKILEKTNNFTALMPEPKPSLTIGDIDLNADLLQAPKTNRAIIRLRHYSRTNGGIMRADEYWSLRMNRLDLIFAANSTVQGWLHSTPVSLGSFTLDSSGAINLATTIPSSVPAGFHTLHLLGKNSSGEDIDLFKTVYVANGELSPCLVPASGQDADKDGTDDACDPMINEPPLDVVPLPDFGPSPNPPSENLPINTEPDDIANPKERESDPETEAPGIVVVPPIQDENPAPPVIPITTRQLIASAAAQGTIAHTTDSSPNVAGANTDGSNNPATASKPVNTPADKKADSIPGVVILAAGLVILLAAATITKLLLKRK